MRHLRSPQRRSAVLILAILLMGAIVGSAISLSTVISDSSHQTTTLNDFISASLAADGGLERGLAIVKAGRINKTLVETAAAAGGATVPSTNVTADFPSTDTLNWPRLRPGESATFDIVYPTNTIGAADAATIVVQGKLVSPGNLANHGDARGQLEISWVGLKNTGEPYYSGRTILTSAQIERYVCTSTCAFDYPVNSINLLSAGRLFDVNGNPISNIDFSLTKGFRIRISAVEHTTNLATTTLNTLADTVTQVTVSKPAPGGASPTPAGFPSRVNIRSQGTINNSTALKTASVLWQLPASGVFNYVLFTEGDLIPR